MGVLIWFVVVEWRLRAIFVSGSSDVSERTSFFPCSGVNLRDKRMRGDGESANGSLWCSKIEVSPLLLVPVLDAVLVLLLLVEVNAIFIVDSIFVVVQGRESIVGCWLGYRQAKAQRR